MYRAVALAALEQDVSLEDEKGLAALAASLNIQFADDSVFLNGENVSVEIRVDRVTTATQSVADALSVREEMKKMQRSLSEEFDLVTEGRDQGTVVFPHAELKFILTHRHQHVRHGGIIKDLNAVTKVDR